MSARETNDLFNKYGRRAVLRAIRQPKVYSASYVWRDTFGPFFCAVLGHKAYVSDPHCQPEWACKRCHRFIDAPTNAQGS